MSLVSSAASKGVTPKAIFTAFSIIADLGDFYFFKAVKLRLGLIDRFRCKAADFL